MKSLLLLVVGFLLENSAFGYFDVSSTNVLQKRLDNLAFLNYGPLLKAGRCRREDLFSELVPPITYFFQAGNAKLQATFDATLSKHSVSLGSQEIVYPHQKSSQSCLMSYVLRDQQFQCSGEGLRGEWGLKEEDNHEKGNDLELELEAGIPVSDLLHKIQEISTKLDKSSDITGVLLVGRKQLMKFTSTDVRCTEVPGKLEYLVKLEGMIENASENLNSLYFDGEHFYRDSECSAKEPTTFTFKGHERTKERIDHRVHFVGMDDVKTFFQDLAKRARYDCQQNQCSVKAHFHESLKVNNEPITEIFVRTLCNGEDFSMAVRTEVMTKRNQKIFPAQFTLASLVYFDEDAEIAVTQGNAKYIAVNLDKVGLYDAKHFDELL